MTGWSKPAFYNLTEGFWATRVANGLTTPEDAVRLVREQQQRIDQWYPLGAGTTKGEQ